MAATRWLTIAGETRSVMEWSRVPGAVPYGTILKRLRILNWPPVEAVFEKIGVRPNRGRYIAYPKKPAPRPPAPHVANPLRPRWGFSRSYSIERLAMLRRAA